MKKIFLALYAKYYWFIGEKLCTMLMEKYGYGYYLRVYNDISKVKDIKTNLLTKEQKLEIDNFYKKYYGKKISYIWHNLIMSYNNKFDVRYIPPDIFIKIRDKLNSNSKTCLMIYDKNFLYEFVKKTNVKFPKRLFYSINNLFFDSANNKISKDDLYKQMSNIGEAFIKPSQLTNSGYARNCKLINMKDGVDVNSNTSIKEIIEDYNAKDFIVQEKIVCHKSISDIYSKSVNTFSLYTIIWNNEVKIIPKPVFKIGMGGSCTDYSGITKEGLVMGLNNDGTLFDFALCVKQDKKYYAHPDTGFVFKNHKIFNFSKILETAKKLHSCIPWLTFCKWDITIGVDGEPIVVEVEKPSELFQKQIFYKEGFFGENTEEMLALVKK